MTICKECGGSTIRVRNKIISKRIRRSYHFECNECGSISEVYRSRGYQMSREIELKMQDARNIWKEIMAGANT